LNKKLLFLLITLTLFVNYVNYLKKDNQKLINKNTLLKEKIEKEVRLSKWLLTHKIKTNIKKYNDMFFSDKLSYSLAMGKMQEIIKNAITKDSKIIRLNWGSSIKTDKFYQPLEMSIAMKITQGNFNKFINNLQSNKKIFKVENLKIATNNSKFNQDRDKLNIYMKIIAYKLQKVQK